MSPVLFAVGIIFDLFVKGHFNSTGMETFFISFCFNNKVQTAEVLMNRRRMETEYNVRPVDPFTVRKFGRQICIFKKKNIYNTRNHIATDYKDLFNSLVDAIRSLEDKPTPV